MEEIQERLLFVDETLIPIVFNGQDDFRIWTFAGGLTNAALAQAIPGPSPHSDDFYIAIRAGRDAASIDAYQELNPALVGPSLSSD